MSVLESPSYYAGLEKAGFNVISEGAVQQQIYVHSGRHYPDIGAALEVIKGNIKVKSGLVGLTENGVDLGSSELPVDVIVYATGFEKDVRKQIYQIMGQDLGLGPIWGLDKEGEVRGVWRNTGNRSIWINGGEMQLLRYMSKYLALQLAADVMGVRP